jgi:hypothetical protein
MALSLLPILRLLQIEVLDAMNGVSEIDFLSRRKTDDVVLMLEMNMASIEDRLAPAMATNPKNRIRSSLVTEIV